MKDHQANVHSTPPDTRFSPTTLARLWPDRELESGWLKNQTCHVGLGRSQMLEFGDSANSQRARFSKIETTELAQTIVSRPSLKNWFEPQPE